ELPMRPTRLIGMLCLCLAALVTVVEPPARAASPVPAPSLIPAISSGDFGPCSLAALPPDKELVTTPYVQAHAVFWYDNNMPRTCTFHVNLQQWSEYFKVWTNVHGHDSWYYHCPPRLAARKEMRSIPFKCLKPEVLYGFRTAVSGTVTWPNGSVETH